MTCSSTVLAGLAQTAAAYILIYCNALSTTFTAVRCFQLRKKVLRLDATSYQIPRIRAQIELSSTFVYDYKMSTSGSSARNSHLSQGGRTTMTDHACESNNITVQNRIIGKILPVNKFTTLKFLSLLPSMNGYFFLDYYVLLCNTCLYRAVHRHGHHCHSSPLAEVRIPRRVAARAHFLVINKGAGQFYLSFDTR